MGKKHSLTRRNAIHGFEIPSPSSPQAAFLARVELTEDAPDRSQFRPVFTRKYLADKNQREARPPLEGEPDEVAFSSARNHRDSSETSTFASVGATEEASQEPSDSPSRVSSNRIRRNSEFSSPDKSRIRDLCLRRARAYTELIGGTPFDSDDESEPPSLSETEPQDQGPPTSIFRDLSDSNGPELHYTRPRFRRAETDCTPAARPFQHRKKPPTPGGLPPPEPFPQHTERASSDPKHSVKLREDYTPSHLRIKQPKFFRVPPTESQARLKDSLEGVYHRKFTAESRRPSFLNSPLESEPAFSSNSPFQNSHAQDSSSPCPPGRVREPSRSDSQRYPGSKNLRPGHSKACDRPPVPKLPDQLKNKQESPPLQGFPPKSSKKERKKKSAPHSVLSQFPQPYTFETSDKRRFDPLNFVPVTSEDSGYKVTPESTKLVLEANRRRTSPGKAPTFDDIFRSVPLHSSFDSQLPRKGKSLKSPILNHGNSEKRKAKKKKSSFSLVGGLKKLFSPTPRLTSEELKALISSPIGPEPEITTVIYKPVPFLGESEEQEPDTDESKKRLLALGPPSGFQHRKPRIPLPDFVFPPRDMDSSQLLDPSSATMIAVTKQRLDASRLAKEQAAAVREMCRRANTDRPPYGFDELIGKGAYGRVYKGRTVPNGNLVAIKVLDIDSADYNSIRDLKDESIKDFIQETKAMRQVKDSGAKNVNLIVEAISIHSQLWLVCEYCPGGSVKTLMRATNNKLDERFIIPIARELAIGLKAIHDAGIIHRDIKAANVLIHEEGNLQICDFGVAGVVQSKVDKRSTWIGTPHWMPPEMFPNKNEVTQYGSEIDVWAYGCTLFECATGNPPNATLRERMQIGRQLNRFPPKLEGEEHSDELRSLVSFSLDTDPRSRPTMGNILDHPCIAESATAYPTESLADLVRIYYQWTQRGGQRISLFNPGGAAAAEVPGEDSLQREDWNFSTTAGFERRFSIIDLDQLSASLADLEGELTPIQSRQPDFDAFETALDDDMTPEQKANFNERVKRGEESLGGLFDTDKPDYKYETKNDFISVEQRDQPLRTDLPLRTDTDRSSVASTFIDINLGAFDSSHYAAGSASNHPFQLADADTIRANRSSSRIFRQSSGERPSSHSSDGGSVGFQEAEYQQPSGPRPPTMDWKFPSSTEPAGEEEPEVEVDEGAAEGGEEDDFGGDKRDTREWTFPVMTADTDDTGNDDYGQPGDDVIETARPLLQLQDPSFERHDVVPSYNLDGPGDSRPSTAASNDSKVSDPDHDPFRFDRAMTSDTEFMSTIRPDTFPDFHTSSTTSTAVDTIAPSTYQTHTEGATSTNATSRQGSLVAEPFTMNKSPTKSLSNTSSIRRGRVAGAAFQFPDVFPPSTESLSEDASDEVVTEEMKRLLGDFINGLAAVGNTLTTVEVGKAGGEKIGESTEQRQQVSEEE